MAIITLPRRVWLNTAPHLAMMAFVLWYIFFQNPVSCALPSKSLPKGTPSEIIKSPSAHHFIHPGALLLFRSAPSSSSVLFLFTVCPVARLTISRISHTLSIDPNVRSSSTVSSANWLSLNSDFPTFIPFTRLSAFTMRLNASITHRYNSGDRGHP